MAVLKGDMIKDEHTGWIGLNDMNGIIDRTAVKIGKVVCACKDLVIGMDNKRIGRRTDITAQRIKDRIVCGLQIDWATAIKDGPIRS